MENLNYRLDSKFKGAVRALVQGKYTHKNVVAEIQVEGSLQENDAEHSVRIPGDDEAILPTTIQEFTSRIVEWRCVHCGASLTSEDVETLRDRVPLECRFCGRTISSER